MTTSKGIANPCSLDKLTVHELKLYLRDRGAHVSGNKSELIKRAQVFVNLRMRTQQEIQTDDKENDNKRHAEIFCTPFGEKIPEPWTLNVLWVCDLTHAPLFRTEDLYNYLLLLSMITIFI
ncbi:hypothetical protein ACJMK2_001195 [Sinanodonta woodiana]|uniref:SAP domain-containing protein n=1 Tax=Sinanodonta woodiana TaxID=1069815 RepID=A0ABD3XUW0_SINWO